MRIKALQAFILLTENDCNFSVHRLLGIPRSNLWGYIDEIEEELGIKLIERRKQLNTFTPEGLAFIPSAIKIIKTLEEAKNKALTLDNTRIQGSLIISTTKAIADSWLMESINTFHNCYPEVKINTFADDKLSKEMENSADVLIRPLSSYSGGNLERKWHIAYHYALFASHDYLKRTGHPKKPEDLTSNHSLIAYGEHEFTYFEEINWHIKGKYGLPKLIPSLTINSASALFQAAANDIGICSLSIEENTVLKRELIRVLPQINGPVANIYCAVKKDASLTTERNCTAFLITLENYVKNLGLNIEYENDIKK